MDEAGVMVLSKYLSEFEMVFVTLVVKILINI